MMSPPAAGSTARFGHKESKLSCNDNMKPRKAGPRFPTLSAAKPKRVRGLVLEAQGIKAREMLTAESQQVTSSIRTLNSARNDRRCGQIQKREGRTGGRERATGINGTPSTRQSTFPKPQPLKWRSRRLDLVRPCADVAASSGGRRSPVWGLQSSGLWAFLLNLTYMVQGHHLSKGHNDASLRVALEALDKTGHQHSDRRGPSFLPPTDEASCR